MLTSLSVNASDSDPDSKNCEIFCFEDLAVFSFVVFSLELKASLEAWKSYMEAIEINCIFIKFFNCKFF
jgi:hypothetical protein